MGGKSSGLCLYFILNDDMSSNQNLKAISRPSDEEVYKPKYVEHRLLLH